MMLAAIYYLSGWILHLREHRGRALGLLKRVAGVSEFDVELKAERESMQASLGKSVERW